MPPFHTWRGRKNGRSGGKSGRGPAGLNRKASNARRAVNADDRRIPIQKVGVKGARYPIVLLDKAKGKQHTTATVSLFADLPHDFKAPT
jgi:ribosomal protein L15